MEWHIPPVSRKSRLTERAFEEGDRVSSSLVRLEDGSLERFDALASEAGEAAFQGQGQLVCRWDVTFKPKRDEGKDEEEAMELTAENLFASLFEGEEEPSQENAKLKHFLALILERRRLLRLERRGSSFDQYIHRPTKIRYFVPAVELDPEFFVENQRRLDFLISGGGEPTPSASSEASASEF